MQAPLKDSLINQYKTNEKTADTAINELLKDKENLNNTIAKKDIKIIKLRWNVVKGVLFGSIGGFIAAVIIF